MDASILKFLGQVGLNQQSLHVVTLILDHKGAAAMAFFFGTGVGVNILVRILNAIPLGWWYSMLRVTAVGVSAVGRQRLTTPVWRPFEVWFENFLGKSVDAIREGLEADDRPISRKTMPATPAPGVGEPPSPSASAPVE